MKRVVGSVVVVAVLGLGGCASMECGTTNICAPKATYKVSQTKIDACTAVKKKLLAQATAGDARAQYFLSSCYLGGFGSPDEAASAKWLQAALSQDLMVAKTEYANWLQNGIIGVKRDPDVARDWVNKALEQWRTSGRNLNQPFDNTQRFIETSLRRWGNGETDFTAFDRNGFYLVLNSMAVYSMMYGRNDQAFVDLCLAHRFNPYRTDEIPHNLKLIGKQLSDCPAE